MNLTTFNSNVATMSSLEIAELTGKKHKHVMADIRAMLDELGIQPAQFSGVRFNSRNKERPCFNLPKRETSILVSGYGIAMYNKIIDRWQELEAKEVESLSPAEDLLRRAQMLVDIERRQRKAEAASPYL